MQEDGKIDYLELPGGDLAATRTFYGQAFGWRFTDFGPGYTAFDADEAGLSGGFAKPAAEATEKPLPILYAHDLEAMHDRVCASGGVVIKPIFAFPGGRRFHFRDPSGNELAVWSKGQGKA